jgi:hypothetical protein
MTWLRKFCSAFQMPFRLAVPELRLFLEMVESAMPLFCKQERREAGAGRLFRAQIAELIASSLVERCFEYSECAAAG